MNKKPHLIYSLLSICVIVLYGSFLIRNAITDANSNKEYLPYTPPVTNSEKTIPQAPTEAAIIVMEEAETVAHLATPSPKIEEPTQIPTEEPTEKVTTEDLEGFSPIFPVDGEVIASFSMAHTYNEKTSDWRAHTGIDIKADPTSRVLCVEDGTVTACYIDSLWGNVIEIDHGEYISVYKNLSTLIMVKEGDFVRRGEAISGVGNSATAEGYLTDHLHFELLHYSEYVNPLPLLTPLS